MTGSEKFKQIGEKLKSESQAEKQEKEVQRSSAKEELANIETDLEDLYRQNADVGSSNLGGSSPILKIHTANKSQNNKLLEGGEPNDGWFYHTNLRKQYENPEVHIIAVTRTFYSLNKNLESGKLERKMFQIIGGLFYDEEESLPTVFKMYLKGISLSPFWDFGKEAKIYTKRRESPIPLFALTVRLRTEKVKHSKGRDWATFFDIVMDGDQPKKVTDVGEFILLRDTALMIEEELNERMGKMEVKTDTPVNRPNSVNSVRGSDDYQHHEDSVPIDAYAEDEY